MILVAIRSSRVRRLFVSTEDVLAGIFIFTTRKTFFNDQVGVFQCSSSYPMPSRGLFDQHYLVLVIGPEIPGSDEC